MARDELAVAIDRLERAYENGGNIQSAIAEVNRLRSEFVKEGR